MPSITPSYLYTFAALLAVSGLLVFSFMAYADTLRFSSETRQLRNLMETVAAKSTELLTLTLATNASAEAFVQMPTAVGNRQYWIQLQNDSATAWLEGGFGNAPVLQAGSRVYLPKEASAAGEYIGGYGVAHLECRLVNEVASIQLSSIGGN